MRAVRLIIQKYSVFMYSYQYFHRVYSLILFALAINF